MKVTKIKYVPGYTKDGTLYYNQGRVVIFGSKIEFSRGNTPDHLTLLGGLAAKYHFKKDDVISDAIRMYYTIEDDVIILSASRKLDEQLFEQYDRQYASQILREISGESRKN